jgi:hypothetical protein
LASSFCRACWSAPDSSDSNGARPRPPHGPGGRPAPGRRWRPPAGGGRGCPATPRAELVSQQPKAGVDPGHGRVQLHVVVFEPDGVALDGGNPLQQQGGHDVVLGPVVVVDETDDGGEGPAERRRLVDVAGRQGVHGPDQTLAVGPHRLVHGDQDAAVLRDRDGRVVAHLGICHACSFCQSGRGGGAASSPRTLQPCRGVSRGRGWYGYRAAALIRFSPVHWPDPSVPDRTGSSGPDRRPAGSRRPNDD